MVFPAGLLVAAALVLGFLAVIAFLGWLAYRGLRGSREGGQGSTGNNLALGCVLAALGLFALLFLGGISALLLFRGSTAQAAAEHRAARDAQHHAEEAARHEEHDEERAEVEAGRRVDEMVRIEGWQHVRLRFEARGPGSEAQLGTLRELVADATGIAWSVEPGALEERTAADGQPYRSIELFAKVNPESLDEIEDEIRERLDELELPAGQSIEYKDTVLDH